MRCLIHQVCVAAALLFVSPSNGHAAAVFEYLPADTQGFLLIKEVGQTDARLTRLFADARVDLPSPMAVLKSVVGVEQGLDLAGDAMFAVLLPDEGASTSNYCLWLPVADYEAFIGALKSGPADIGGITAITVAGEDLLIAKQGRWALVMDPDKRTRMKEILAAVPVASPLVEKWSEWLGQNQVTVVMFAAGISNTLSGTTVTSPQSPDSADDLFDSSGQEPIAAPSSGILTGQVYSELQREYRRWLGASPILQQWAAQTTAVACGLQLEKNGGAKADIRLAFAGGLNIAPEEDKIRELPRSLIEKGDDFVIHGCGAIPTSISAPLASAFTRTVVDEFKRTDHLQFDADAVSNFQAAAERAAAVASSTRYVVRPGSNDEGVYTNYFAIVDAESAADFCDRAADVIQSWNRLNLGAKGETRFVFEVATQDFDERAAKQFSLDIASADGAPDLPEIRQAMEKFFGPGGKMQIWIVPVDDHTALLAMATREQVASMLTALDQKTSTGEKIEQSPSNLQLAADELWRAEFSPENYVKWLHRFNEAMVGTDVIGGPVSREFPASPPLGIALGARTGEAWVDVTIPAGTIQAAGTYFESRSPAQSR